MNISRGNIEWETAQHQWYSHPVNTFGFLGWHNSVCHTESLPVAQFVVAPPLQVSLYNDIQAGNQYTNYNMYISLVGSGWSNPINVFYNQGVNFYTYYYTNALNCTSPSYTNYQDFSYPANNWVTFSSMPSGGNPANSFPLQIQVTTTQSDIISNGASTYIWGCFGIDVDPNNNPPFNYYDIGTNYTANLYITTDDLSGIQTLLDNKQIKIYPNPFNTQVTIENKSKTPITKIIVSDVLGREITTLKPNQLGTINIDTHNFNSGVYFIKVYNNDDNYSVKLIKE